MADYAWIAHGYPQDRVYSAVGSRLTSHGFSSPRIYLMVSRAIKAWLMDHVRRM